MLRVTCGKVHEYLGMTIYFCEKGKVKFTMYNYIAGMLEEIPEDTKTGESSTPSGDHLFTTNKYNTEKLIKEEIITFHHVTSKLLYLAKRARPDLQLCVTVLCTRVKDLDKDYWKKLTRVMKYI